jgi:hypothetical protein
VSTAAAVVRTRAAQPPTAARERLARVELVKRAKVDKVDKVVKRAKVAKRDKQGERVAAVRPASMALHHCRCRSTGSTSRAVRPR